MPAYITSSVRWLRSKALTAFMAGLCLGSVQAQTTGAPLKLRIVGGLATVNQFTRHEEPFWSKELARLTQGRVNAEIVAFDRAGIRGQEMLRLMQLGAVPFGTILLSQSSAQEPILAAPDLAGLNPDVKAVRRTVSAFRPYLEKTLRERYGIELLATYIYPAQVIWCNKPMAALTDVARRRVRVSSAAQSDFVEALGGIPVQTAFAEIVANVKSGNIECAITGTMSGNTIGLQEVTSHLHSMAISWGMSVFGANSAAWNSLPEDVKTVLRQQMPRLESEVWGEADRETGDGLACNSGADACQAGRKGQMTVVRASAEDERRRREFFASTVLPRFVQRCGPQCADVWNQTIGPGAGFEARAR